MDVQIADLKSEDAVACEKISAPLSRKEIDRLLANLPGWELDNGGIARTYRFKDHYQTLAFVNALAWISHREDHHPDLTVGYNTCRVYYHTHSVNGITPNDFVCARKVDGLFEL